MNEYMDIWASASVFHGHQALDPENAAKKAYVAAAQADLKEFDLICWYDNDMI